MSESDPTVDKIEAMPAVPAGAVAGAVRFPWFAYLLSMLLSLCVLGCGLLMLFWFPDRAEQGSVSEIRIILKGGIDLSKVEEILDTPDYYIQVASDQGSIRTQTFGDTRVGSGLTFRLPVPIRIEDIREIRVWDEDTLKKDRLVDRTDRPAREVEGEKFKFQLMGSEPAPTKDRKVGLVLSISGGVVLLLVLLKIVRAQVV